MELNTEEVIGTPSRCLSTTLSKVLCCLNIGMYHINVHIFCFVVSLFDLDCRPRLFQDNTSLMKADILQKKELRPPAWFFS